MKSKTIEELKKLSDEIYKLKRHRVPSVPFNLPGFEKETVTLESVIDTVHKYINKVAELEKEITVSEAIERLAEEYPLMPVQIQYMLENAGKRSINIELGTRYGDNVEYGTRSKENKYEHKVVDELRVAGEALSAVINKYRDLNYAVDVSVEFERGNYGKADDFYCVKIIKAIEVDEDVK